MEKYIGAGAFNDLKTNKRILKLILNLMEGQNWTDMLKRPKKTCKSKFLFCEHSFTVSFSSPFVANSHFYSTEIVFSLHIFVILLVFVHDYLGELG